MMKKFVLVLCLLLPSMAFAAERYTSQPPNPHPAPPPSKWENVLEANQATNVGVETVVGVIVKTEAEANVGDTTATGGSVGPITTTATGGAGGAGGAGGTGGNATGGNVGPITMTGGGVNINHPRQIASAYAPAVFPTAICEGGQSFALQTRNFGASWTKSDSRREACLFALAQQWMVMGEYELACGALMATRAAAHAYGTGDEKPSCKERRGPAPQGLVSAPQQPLIIILNEDVDEKLRRIVEAFANSK